jgi:hypothetical protein
VPTLALSAKTIKFTFNNVTFSDGTLGVIETGSKQTGGGSTFTVCDYYTSDWATYLGQYQDSTFFSSDPGILEQFCLDHYADRTLS